jgi:hypothetical protein
MTWRRGRISGMLGCMLMSTPPSAKVRPPPSCDDCRMPATFRTEIADPRSARAVRVYQCGNCAKVIWHD